MKRHPLLLHPENMDCITGIVGIYLRELERATSEYLHFWDGYNDSDSDSECEEAPSENLLRQEEEAEKRMVCRIAQCLWLLNELLLRDLLIKWFRMSEETVLLYIKEAKEVMNKNTPV